jgi:hypothetical protein
VRAKKYREKGIPLPQLVAETREKIDVPALTKLIEEYGHG